MTAPRLAACALAMALAIFRPSEAAVAAGSAGGPPNVLLIVSDDQGWGDLGAHGNPQVRTPNLDSLARDGARFERFYVSPVCAPTRAALLTGRWALRTGVTGVTRGEERMNLGETTLAEVFKAAGYATGAFGKWHNGSQYPYHPNGRGFAEFHGFCCGHWGTYFDPWLEDNGREVQAKGYITDDLTDRAIDFMERRRGGPFLCYVAYNVPHSPMDVPDADFDRLAARPIERRADGGREDELFTRTALAMVENMDANIGRLLAKLDASGLRERTIVVFLSDNGPNSWRWNGGMRGRKGSVDEGGTRVPCLVRWPGRVKAGATIAQIAADVDLLPTLADLAGIAARTAKPVDGVSLRPLLEGAAQAWPDRMIFSALGKKMSVRTQRHWADEKTLYDLQADPGQENDVAAKLPEVHRELADALRRWRAEVAPAVPVARPFSVGYRAFPTTVLPAQDAEPQGPGLRFSSRHPNSAWLTGWTDLTARVTWDIEVATAGRYAVELRYCCPAADVGAEVELAFGDRRVSGRVTQPCDPPLLSAPDRVPREESRDKVFGRLALGTIELPAGRGTLVLRGLNRPGGQIMELRAASLTLLPD